MTEVKIIIDYIHFHFVDKEKPLNRLPHGGVTNISSAVQEAYIKYIFLVTNKSQSSECYDIYYVESVYAQEVKKEIDTMLKRPVPQEAKELEKSAYEMALKLLSKMKKTGKPKPGVLFQVVYREDGIRKICFLKLESVDEVYFDYDENKSSLTRMELLEKLPSRGRFQKGAIYPHPNDSRPDLYMKVYQRDAEAYYFESFLGGAPGISGRDIMKESKRLARSATGESLTFEQEIGLFQGMSNHLKKKRKQVEATDMIRIIQDALPYVPKKAIKEIVTTDLKVTGVADGAEVEDLKISFRIGGIHISGSYSEIDNRFEFEGAGPNKHTIQGIVDNIALGSR